MKGRRQHGAAPLQTLPVCSTYVCMQVGVHAFLYMHKYACDTKVTYQKKNDKAHYKDG